MDQETIMPHGNTDRLPRRTFLRRTLGSAALAGLSVSPARGQTATKNSPPLQAGEGVVDVTPPLGITMGGFHFVPSNPRRITGVRRPSAVRALLLQLGDSRTAIVSVDMLNVSHQMVRRTQRMVGKAAGMPPLNVRICATHSHSMPTIALNRQWGDQHPEYIAGVEKSIVRAVQLAQEDLAPAELSLGKSVAEDANNNRTSGVFKTEDQFTKESTDGERWLDRTVRVMHFARSGGRRNLLWYHFSAHPTCYNNTNCGPDWPGAVTERWRDLDKISPSFLQGHIGDVAPGGGGLGNAEHTSLRVFQAMSSALQNAKRITPSTLRVQAKQVLLPLDIETFKQQIAHYKADPQPAGSFDRDWYENFATKWDLSQDRLTTTVAAIQLGELALVFQPSELYTCYGLAIQRDSPLPKTIVVGFADGYVGYLPDPKAFEAGEYAAIKVPKILDFPQCDPSAARHLTGEAVGLLKALVA